MVAATCKAASVPNGWVASQQSLFLTVTGKGFCHVYYSNSCFFHHLTHPKNYHYFYWAPVLLSFVLLAPVFFPLCVLWFLLSNFAWSGGSQTWICCALQKRLSFVLCDLEKLTLIPLMMQKIYPSGQLNAYTLWCTFWYWYPFKVIKQFSPHCLQRTVFCGGIYQAKEMNTYSLGNLSPKSTTDNLVTMKI